MELRSPYLHTEIGSSHTDYVIAVLFIWVIITPVKLLELKMLESPCLMALFAQILVCDMFLV